MKLATVYYNQCHEAFPYRMSGEEEEALVDLLDVYSPHGPLRKLSTYFGLAGAGPVFVGHTEFYDTDTVLRRLTSLWAQEFGASRNLVAGGKGVDLPRMFLSSTAEMVERVFGTLSSFGREAEVVHGTYQQLSSKGYPCLHPSEVHLFAAEQYGRADLIFEPFTPESWVGWLPGRRLISGEEIWAPSQLVAPFHMLHPEEAIVGFATTCGLASHINEREALFHGITELFERDAVNIRWRCKLPPAVIDFDCTPELDELTALIEAYGRLPGKVSFLLHSVGFPELPVVTAVQFLPWLKRYSFYAGSGVNFDIERAILQAFGEFGQSEITYKLALNAPDRLFAKVLGRSFDVDEDTPVADIDNFIKILSYYGYPKNQRKLEWYLRGDRVGLSTLPRYEPPSAEARFSRLLQILEQYGLDPLIFDFTAPQMKRLRILKVFIPELVPPHIASLPLLGHPRYCEVPARLAVNPLRLTFDDLLKDPLPYP
jgi:ribosomal protein S12 methylthiotransferase accessory factor